MFKVFVGRCLKFQPEWRYRLSSRFLGQIKLLHDLGPRPLRCPQSCEVDIPSTSQQKESRQSGRFRFSVTNDLEYLSCLIRFTCKSAPPHLYFTHLTTSLTPHFCLKTSFRCNFRVKYLMCPVLPKYPVFVARHESMSRAESQQGCESSEPRPLWAIIFFLQPNAQKLDSILRGDE